MSSTGAAAGTQTHEIQRGLSAIFRRRRLHGTDHTHRLSGRGGEIVCQIAAEKTTEQWMDAGLNTRVWLEMLYEGQTVRVSNILEF